jgi:hypothetical protein
VALKTQLEEQQENKAQHHQTLQKLCVYEGYLESVLDYSDEFQEVKSRFRLAAWTSPLPGSEGPATDGLTHVPWHRTPNTPDTILRSHLPRQTAR